MKAWKAFCLTILLACLPSMVWAESACFLDERFPEHYQASFTSNTGKICFAVDAVVEVPHVTEIPLYQATMRVFQPEEVRRLAEMLLPSCQPLYSDGQWYETTASSSAISRYFEIVYIPQEAQRSTDAFEAWGTYVSGSYMELQGQAAFSTLFFSHTLPEEGVYYNLSENMSGDSLDRRLTVSRIPGHPYTADSAQAMADEVIFRLAPQLKLISVCQTEASYNYTEEELDRHNDPSDPFTIDPALVAEKLVPAYVFTYARELHGIPVTYTTTNCSLSESYSRTWDYEKCFVIVSNRGIEYVGYMNPLECGAQLAPSCELLPFDDIAAVAQSVMPIQYDAEYSLPVYASVELRIDRVALGYMRVKVQHAEDAYQLIPVWDFFGTVEAVDTSGQRFPLETSPNNSVFTVNAMDGTVIDRAYGY